MPSKQNHPQWLWVVLLLPVLWLAALVASVVESAADFSGRLAQLQEVLTNPLRVTWTPSTLKMLLIFTIVYALAVLLFKATRRNLRPGEEHGSAQWGDAHQLCAKYRDKHARSNIILTKHICMGLDGRKHRRNLNVLVVGGTGAGKTRFYVLPNILQANTSFIVTDAKGEILRATGHLLIEKGYDIRVFDLINPGTSHGYNPFSYIRDDKDVLKGRP